MKCIAHRLGLDWECRTPEECNANSVSSNDIDPAHCGFSGVDAATHLGRDDSDHSDGPESFDDDDFPEGRQTYKDDSALKDQQSTGRKRAARWYPLDETKLCEWSMKKNCGGGPKPITGCLSSLQQARHHGPDKNTLNNDKGNVHRICHTCHNRWHTLNDGDYVWNDVQNLHAPEPATIDDIAKNEEFWAGRKLVKAKD